jgi:L-amino acid N-acyltransferase YncA
MTVQTRLRHEEDANLHGTIRLAETNDFDAIRRLHQQTFQEHQSREPTFGDTPPFIEPYLEEAEWLRTSVRAWLLDTGFKILVDDRDGDLAGYIAYDRRRFWIAPHVFVSDISIAPAWRRRGVARGLIEAMEASEADSTTIEFHASVWPENAASKALFGAVGYTSLGTRKFPGPDGEYALYLFRKRVPFSSKARWLLWGRNGGILAMLAAIPWVSRLMS